MYETLRIRFLKIYLHFQIEFIDLNFKICFNFLGKKILIITNIYYNYLYFLANS